MTTLTMSKVKICKHGVPFKRKYNSTIMVNDCFECKMELHLKNLSIQREQANRYKKGNSLSLVSKKTNSKQSARDNADKWFSRYIRLKYHSCIVGGEVYCRDIITGIQYHARNMDNGHCFSRDHSLLRYEEDDCRPQNKADNHKMVEGDKIHQTFKDNLIKQIGIERFRRLLRLKRQEGDRSLEFYQETAIKYRKSTKQLLTQLYALKWWTT